MTRYCGLVSSDWSECLSPNGPFDFMSFAYPEIKTELAGIFNQYTANQVALSEAMQRCRSLLPGPIGVDQMDAYLDQQFAHYTGVPELIERCLSNDVLFMINTTGSTGYFQRVFHKKLLPRVAALSAHPALTYAVRETGLQALFELHEITDKAVNTAKAAQYFEIPPQKVVVMGDSGGDGPHFKWAARQGAARVASMAKPSLKRYCHKNHIGIQHFFGISYRDGEPRRPAEEMRVDFQGLMPILAEYLDIPRSA